MRWWPWPRKSGTTDADLRADLQRVRLELEERDEQLRRARADLARERGSGEDRRRESADAEVAELLATMGTPLTQLVTLAHLHGRGAAEPRPGDVLAIGMRLVRALEDRDVEAIGTVGAHESFDPARHDPVGADVPAVDQPVVIRFVGFAHRSRVLRKAGIEPAQTPDDPRRVT